MLTGLDEAVLLGVAVLVGSLVAPRLRLAVPPALLLIGVLLGFVPSLRAVALPPEVVLLLFLPALLFWESLTTSLRSIRRDFRGIALLSTLLPVATAFAVAGVGTAFGMPWSSALILGAAIAPPDATAVGALGQSLPRRNFMILKAESLTNDGTALVVYAIAVGLATGDSYTPLDVTGMVLVSYLGGIACGAATAAAGYAVLRRLQGALQINLVLLVIPFTAYLLAETISASGVLATVISGLVLAYLSDRISTAASRRMTEDFWPIGTTMLNGALFVLIGLQAQRFIRHVEPAVLGRLALLAVALWIVLLVVRFTFQMVTVQLIRLLDRRPSQRKRRMRHTARVVSSVAGFRGAVSLAIALSVPELHAGVLGSRDAIVLVTAGIIALTLLVQGPILPAVVRWARLPEDNVGPHELQAAERRLSEVAAAAVGTVAEQQQTPDTIRRHVQAEADAAVRANSEDGGDQAADDTERATKLRLELIRRKRAELATMRRTGDIDDQIARQLRNELDLDELRLQGRHDLQ